MPPRKRKAEDEEEDDNTEDKRHILEEIKSKIQALDETEANAYLDMLCERWHLENPPSTFEHTVSLAFHNFQQDVLGDIQRERVGSYGLQELADTIHEHEIEGISLFHHLRELDIIGENDSLRRISKCLECIYYAKRIVLSTFQAKIAVTDPNMELDQELDTLLGLWTLRFRWFGESINDVQKLLLHLLDAAMEKRYRKIGDRIFEPIIVDGFNTHAWKSVCDIEQFVYTECQKEIQLDAWINLTNGNNNAKAVISYLEKSNDHQFPRLQKDRNVWSFQNGLYDGKKDTFHRYATDPPLPNSVVACKYFDIPADSYDGMPWRDIPTPNVQSIFEYQGFSSDVVDWFYILAGRMMYPVGDRDGWQVIPFLLGQAGTGKCFAHGTMIMMADGTSRAVEDVRVGDHVMGDDFAPRTVLSLARGYDMLYDVVSDHGTMRVTPEHILCLKYTHHKTMVVTNGSVRVYYYGKKDIQFKDFDDSDAATAFLQEIPDEHVIELSVDQYLALFPSQKRQLRMYKRSGILFDFKVHLVPGVHAYYGFELDGNKRFCLADGTVTHNSSITNNVIAELYDATDVGLLSNNSEKTFGIGAFYDKFIFVAPEIKSDMKLEQAEFQSMCSGEEMQIAIKHKTAFSMRWTTPGFLAGNETPSWTDNSGSIQRRVIVFNFERPVVGGDMMLGQRLKQEMSAFIIKANRAYMEASSKYASKNIWEVLPSYFKSTRNEMAASVNSVEAFLTSADVVFDPSKFCPFEDFKCALKVFESQNGYKASKFTVDFFRGPFAKYKITKVKDMLEYRGRKVKREYLMGIDLVVRVEENALG